ncbi:Predicted ATPase [Paucidesulfovibrio gracilis DSM 16080]|uniref:Predicted ATPase n=2 Tax=Paucidesulfovibrio TaxID=2910985 RepID=A0A1T4YAU3_9BACT|nr:Predicted ATPase [Paucidesulfovibrio gracilis DSM 16080]
MQQPQLIKILKLKNILSFGEAADEIKLGGLNVLIGPNGSGKSNLIEAVSLLQAAPSSITNPMRRKGGGGVRDWLWQGRKDNASAELEAVISNGAASVDDLRYRFAFSMVNQRFEMTDESLEFKKPAEGQQEAYFFYKYQNNHPVLNVKAEKRTLKHEDVDPGSSILAQRKDPDQYPELTWVGEQFEKIRIYREWSFGRNADLRKPQDADAPNDILDEDCLNLGLVLNYLRRKPAAKRAILQYLGKFYGGIEDFDISVSGGTVQLFLQEGDFPIPATRLSDGTLRFICLLAILCHPTPPPLVCIEEPELGLHPDIIPTLAKLLTEASERTQVIVTTHSDILVDELTDTPDCVLVCDKEDGATSIRNLDSDSLKKWLEKYSLGQLWLKGEIGGTRW